MIDVISELLDEIWSKNTRGDLVRKGLQHQSKVLHHGRAAGDSNLPPQSRKYHAKQAIKHAKQLTKHAKELKDREKFVKIK